MKNLIGIFLLIWSANARSAPHHQGTLSSVNLGIRYSSILANRGVIFYRDFQIDPVLGVFLFDDRLEFLGDSLGYRDFIWRDQIRLRTRMVSITDKPLFPAYDSLQRDAPHRADTYEWNTRAEFFLPDYNEHYLAEIDLGYSRDIGEHFGNYVDLQAKVKLAEFHKLDTKIEPNLFFSVGAGDSAHNKYFYGPSAEGAGVNNFSYGLWLAFPEEADRYYPIIQLVHFETIGEKNQNAEFARGRNEGWLFSFIATYGLLE